MNRIYKTVWNEQAGTFVAASEITKSRGKRGSSRSLVGAAVVMSALGLAAPAHANTITTNGTNNGATPCVTGSSGTVGGVPMTPTTMQATDGSGTYSLVSGCNATGHRGDPGNVNGNLAVTGYGAFVDLSGEGATAVGFNAKAGKWATALGLHTAATGESSTAIGFKSQATGASAVAIGDQSLAETNSIALGQGAAAALGSGGNGGIAIGQNASAASLGSSNLAIGDNAVATGSAVGLGDSTAIGTGAEAIGQDSTAVGGQTTASGKNTLAIGNNGTTASATGATAFGVASQATGAYALAAGSSAAASGAGAIAVGSNATAAATAVGANAIAIGGESGVVAAGTSGIAVGRGARVNGAFGIAQGDGVISGATGQNVAIGSSGTTANSDNAQGGAVAIGREQSATGNGAVAIGDPNVADGTGAVAIGADNTAGGPSGNNQGVVAIGNGNTAKRSGSVALGNGAVAGNDGTTGVSIGQNTRAESGVAIGEGARTNDGQFGISIGNNTRAGLRSVAMGFNATANGDGAVAIGGTGTTASVAGGVALGEQAKADRAGLNGATEKFSGTAVASTRGAVSVGSAGNERQITNVAGGTADTDAVNVRQLQAVADASATHYYSVNSTTQSSGSNYNNTGATGVDALAAGVNARASGANTVAIGGSGNVPGTAARAESDRSIAIGIGSRTAGQPSAIALGDGAMVGAAGEASVAMGRNAIAYRSGAIAIGDGALAGNIGTNRAYAIAIGTGATADSTNAIVLGHDAKVIGNAGSDIVAIGTGAGIDGGGGPTAGNGSTAVGAHASIGIGGHYATAIGGGATETDAAHASGARATALGSGSNASGTDATAIGGSSASGNEAIAVGKGAQSSGLQAMALGAGANATTTGGVALGGGSSADRAGMNGAVELFSGTAVASTRGAVSVGTAGGERQITNVAGGTNATDAVNVRQLQAVADAIDDNTTHYYSVNDNSAPGGNYDNDGATGENALAAGIDASAAGIRDVAVGAAATTGEVAGATVEQGDNIAVGQATATGGGSIALGYGAEATGSSVDGNNNAVAVGYMAKAQDYNGTALGTGATTGEDAAFSTAIGSTASVADGAYESVAIGSNSSAMAAFSTAIGSGASVADSGGVALGTNAQATAKDSVALGSDSVADGTTLGDPAWQPLDADGNPIAVAGTTPVGEVSIGSAGNERRITNVAAGANDTDAVNVSQLTALADEVEAGQTHYYSVNDDGEPGGNYNNDGATGANALAAGVSASATGANSTAIGNGAKVAYEGGVAIGNGAFVTSNGEPGSPSAANGIAIGTRAHAKQNGVALGNGAHAETTSSILAIGNGAYAGNEAIHIGTSTIRGNRSNHSGAFRRGSTLIGGESNSQGLYSTVVGSHNNLLSNENLTVGGILGYGSFVAQGAFSNIQGAYNTVGSQDTTNSYNSVAVTVTGSANTVQDSNGALVAGYGNTITNSYDDQLDLTGVVGATADSIADLIRNNSTQLGQVGVIGAGNVLDGANNTLLLGMRNDVSDASMASVQGFRNEASGLDNVSIAGADNQVTDADHAFIAGNDNTVNDVSHVLAMGSGQTLDGASQSVLLGDNIAFDGTQAVAIGDDAQVADQAVAVGVTAQALGEQSIALGYDAIATGSIAAGASSRAGNGGAAFGDGAVATYLDGATTAGTVAGAALGQNASADVSGAVALGTDAEASAENSVALGAGSQAVRDVGSETAYVPPGATTVAGADAAGGEVSVGSIGAERRITNVAAGAEDTDAVNVSQLKAAQSEATTHYYSVSSANQELGSNYLNDGATGAGALAAGVAAKATGDQGTAVGAAANSQGYRSVAVGFNAIAGDENSIAIGTNAQADEAGAVALGAGSVTDEAVGTEEATVEGITYGGFAGTAPQSTVSVGAAGAERTITNVAAGRIDANSTDAINGSQLFATQTVIGNVANSTVNVLGGDARVDEDGNITMGGDADGTPGTGIGGTGESTIDDAIRAINDTASAGWSYTTTNDEGDTSDPTKVNSGATVDFGNTDGNIEVSKDTGGLNFDLADDITVDSVTADDGDGNSSTLTAGGLEVADAAGNSTTYGADGMVIDGGPSVTADGIDAGGEQITGVASGMTDADGNAVDLDDAVGTNAANINDLRQAVGSITDAGSGGGFGLADEHGAAFTQDLGTTAKITGDGQNIHTTVVPDGTDSSALQVSLADQLELGQTESAPGAGDGVDGSLAVNGQDGVAGVGLNGADGSIDLTNGDGDTTNLRVVQGDANLDDAASGAGSSQRLEYTDANGAPQQVATMNDGLIFAGDSGANVDRKLGTQLNVVGGATGPLSSGNIGVVANGSDTLTVQLAQNVDLGPDGSVAIGDTRVDGSGLTITGGPSVTTDGIDAGGNKITNVAQGTDPTDAVNLSQLQNVQQGGVQYDRNADGSTNLESVTLNPNGDAPTAIHNVAPGRAGTDAVNVNQLNALNDNVIRNDHRASAGIAAAIATAGLPQAYLPGKSMFGMAVGTWRGEAGIALGLSRVSDNGHWIIKGTATSSSRGDYGGSVGVGYQW